MGQIPLPGTSAGLRARVTDGCESDNVSRKSEARPTSGPLNAFPQKCPYQNRGATTIANGNSSPRSIRANAQTANSSPTGNVHFLEMIIRAISHDHQLPAALAEMIAMFVGE